MNWDWGVLLRKPTDEQVRAFLRAQSSLPFSYAAVGATRGELPPGYVIDHNRVALGGGQATFERARQALAHWKMFELGWMQLCWPDAPLVVGTTVGVVVPMLGFWLLNACRIVYVIDEQQAAIARFGFAYGTLPGHLEEGEERFLVEWNRTDNTVWYDILAFSRPYHWLARVGYPVARFFQKRFARDSKRAMRKVSVHRNGLAHDRVCSQRSCLDR